MNPLEKRPGEYPENERGLISEKELEEMAKQTREIERKSTILSTSDPHRNS